MDLLLTALTILGIILTLIGSYIAYNQWNDQRKEIRIREFKINHKSVRDRREFYSSKMYKEYLKMQGEEEDKSGEKKQRFLLTKNGWIPKIIIDLCEKKVVEVDKKQKRIRKINPNDLVNPPRRRFLRRRFLFPEGPSYADNSKHYLDKNLFNGDTFRVVNVNTNDGLKITISKSRYYDYYNTCEYLLYLATCGINEQEKRKEHKERICRIKDPFDFNNRSVAIGGNTLTIIKNIIDDSESESKKHYFLIHKRSDKVSEAMNTVSVVPAGGLLDVINKKDEDYEKKLIWGNILREFEEEVNGISEVEDTEEYDAERVDKKGIRFLFLGVGLDPLTTKMEAMSCMIVDAEESNIFKKTCNSLKNNLKESYEGKIELVEFTKDNLRLHMNNKRSMPVFREIMRIAIDSFDNLLKIGP